MVLNACGSTARALRRRARIACQSAGTARRTLSRLSRVVSLMRKRRRLGTASAFPGRTLLRRQPSGRRAVSGPERSSHRRCARFARDGGSSRCAGRALHIVRRTFLSVGTESQGSAAAVRISSMAVKGRPRGAQAHPMASVGFRPEGTAERRGSPRAQWKGKGSRCAGSRQADEVVLHPWGLEQADGVSLSVREVRREPHRPE